MEPVVNKRESYPFTQDEILMYINSSPAVKEIYDKICGQPADVINSSSKEIAVQKIVKVVFQSVKHSYEHFFGSERNGIFSNESPLEKITKAVFHCYEEAKRTANLEN